MPLTFLAPEMLPWLGLIALPVAVHLWNRRRRREIVLPTAGFFGSTERSRGRGRVLSDRLRLLIRMAAVAAAALAMARPAWRFGGDDAGAAGRAVAILIDASASMNRTRGGITLFQRAIDQAEQLARSLDPARDRAALILAGRRPRTLMGPTANIGALIGALRDAEPTREGLDPRAALDAADAMFDAAVEAHFFSDFQATQFPDGWSGGSSGPRLVAHHIAPADDANVAITAVSLSPADPIVGEIVTASATIVNFGRELRRVTVTFTNDAVVSTRVVELSPQTPTQASATFVWQESGVRVVEVEIPEDRFTADDRAWASARVRERRTVALITEATSIDASPAARHVRLAIEPDRTSPFGVVTLSPRAADWPPGVLTTADAVVIVDAGRPDDQALESLRAAMLDRPLALWWIVDSAAAVEALRAFDAAASEHEPTLPVIANEWLPQAQVAWFEVAEPGSRLLTAFGPAALRLIESMTAGARASGAERSQASVPLRFSDGGPALVVAPFGPSRAAVWLASISPADSSWPRSPLFPVLVHELLGSLRPEAMHAMTARVGEPVRMEIPLSALNVVDGRGSQVASLRLRPEVAFEINSLPSGLTIDARPLQEPGLIESIGPDGELVAAVPVLLDPAESDPSANPPASEAPPTSVGAPVPDGQRDPIWRSVEFAPALFVATLVLLAVESVWRWRKAR